MIQKSLISQKLVMINFFSKTDFTKVSIQITPFLRCLRISTNAISHFQTPCNYNNLN